MNIAQLSEINTLYHRHIAYRERIHINGDVYAFEVSVR